MSNDLIYLDVDQIEVPSWARSIDRAYMEESISGRGIIKPLIVAKVGDKYLLVDGVGRLEVAKKNNITKVPCRVVEVESEDQVLLLAIELEYTKKTWDLEYTFRVIQELEKQGYPRTEIAKILRIPRSTLYRIITIMELPRELEYLKQLFLKGALPLRAADLIKEALNILSKSKIKKVVNDAKELYGTDERAAGYIYDRIKAYVDREKKQRQIKQWLEEIEVPQDVKVEFHGDTVDIYKENTLVAWKYIYDIESKEDLEKLLMGEDEFEELKSKAAQYALEITGEAHKRWPKYTFISDDDPFIVKIVDPATKEEIAEIDIVDNDYNLRPKEEIMEEIEEEIRLYEEMEEAEEEEEPEEKEITEGEVEEAEVSTKIDIDKMRRETEEAVKQIIQAHYPGVQVEVLSDEDLEPSRPKERPKIDEKLRDTILKAVGNLKIEDWKVLGPYLYVYTREEELDLDTLINIYNRIGKGFAIQPYRMRYLKLRFYIGKGGGGDE